jgi:predicted nucleotidyltransferase
MQPMTNHLSPTGYKQSFETILACLLEACTQLYGNRLISFCVFGSVGAGTMRPDSDIDLLIVCDPLPPGRMARVREFEDVDRICEETLNKAMREGVTTTFSPIIKTPAEVKQGSPVFLDMTETMRILFDREGFFQQYIEDLKERLFRLGSRKVSFGGGYYWILKPDLRPGEEITL